MKRIFIKKESRRSRFRGGAAAGTAESLIKSRQNQNQNQKPNRRTLCTQAIKVNWKN